MNSIVQVLFVDFERGERLAILRQTEGSDGGRQTPRFQSRVDIVYKGQPPYTGTFPQPVAGEESFLSVIRQANPESNTRVQIRKISGIMVQPTSSPADVVLHMEVIAIIVRNIPVLDDLMDGDRESATTERFNLCGILHDRWWTPEICHLGVWDEANQGHIVWTGFTEDAQSEAKSTVATVIPSGSILSTGSGDVRVVEFRSDNLQQAPVLYATRPFQSSTWSLTSGIPSTTRALDFSSSTRALVRKTPTVSQRGVSTTQNRMEVFMTNSPSSPTHWLSQVRINMVGQLATASSYHSIEVEKTYELRQKCNYQTCNGCDNLNVQRLCYGAQQCTIARCIGTLTNQNRPLCGIGQTGQAVFMTMISMQNAAWNMFVETIATVIGLSLTNRESTEVRVEWIDDGFYSAVCSAKDASATFISIITSTVNFIVQSISSRPVTYIEMGAQKIDSNFQAMFTLTLTSINNLLNQIVLGVFYVMFAMQKIVVCETNSILGVVDEIGFKVTLGMAEVQVRVWRYMIFIPFFQSKSGRSVWSEFWEHPGRPSIGLRPQNHTSPPENSPRQMQLHPPHWHMLHIPTCFHMPTCFCGRVVS